MTTAQNYMRIAREFGGIVTKVIFDGVVEIGRRLEEVKALVPHGEWTEYLEAQLGYK